MSNLRTDLDNALYPNTYAVDAEEAHIRIIDQEVCAGCEGRPCTVICPAAVFLWEGGRVSVRYSGCLECGACRFICPRDNLAWSYPRGGFGLTVRHG